MALSITSNSGLKAMPATGGTAARAALRDILIGGMALLAPQQHRPDQEQDPGDRLHRTVRQQAEQAARGDWEPSGRAISEAQATSSAAAGHCG